MKSADGRHVIVHNGEIYNFLDLKPLLNERGIVFQSHTDTEVLLEGVAQWGTGALNRLDGMFAFAVFDCESGELLIARDPFGEKPLYYMELQGGGLAFASELHALTRVPGFDDEVSVDAMAELLMFQYIGHPRTIYKSVRKLPPGHWLRVARDGALRVQRYFKFEPSGEDVGGRSLADVADELEDILVRSIRRLLVADVPVGALLSGGVDSSTVCALAKNRLGRSLKTFSMGFSSSPESEHVAARAFAEHLGLEHVQNVLTPQAIELLPSLGGWLDEPNVDWSCLPVYLLSSLAREQVTVALSGDGGDEMFAGYSWYFPPLEAERTASTAGSPAWRADEAYSFQLLMSGTAAITRLFGCVPMGVAERIRALRTQINESSEPLVFRLRRNEAENYLPGAVLAKVDRMSMRHALEVRTPFLSVEVARFAAGLPSRLLYESGRGKLILREVAYRHLPRNLIDRPKMGFGIPGADWGGKEIRAAAQDLLGSSDSRLRCCLGAQTLDDFLADDPDTHRQWALVVMESWLRSHPATLPDVSTQALRDRAAQHVPNA